MRYLLFHFFSSFQKQVLHHQSLSSQITNALLANSTNSRRNQIVTENSKNRYVFQQRFQQNLWFKYISSPVNLKDIIPVPSSYKLSLIAVINFTLLGFIESQFKTILTR